MSRGGTKERKTLGAAKGSTPFRVESIDDGAHRWPFLPRNYRKLDQRRTRKFVRSQYPIAQNAIRANYIYYITLKSFLYFYIFLLTQICAIDKKK